MSDPPKPEEKPKRPVPPERSEYTVHRTVLAGQEVAYTATAGTVHLKMGQEEPQAAMFYVAYVVDSDRTDRPITFAFNGGPGSSSVWLHLGTFGPRRVDMPDAELPPPPPYRLVDNPDGLLDVTDLVFIDPIGTGFSRSVGTGEDKAFQSVKDDVASVAEFIEAYLQRTGRWNAPRFLAGESYGSTRAAALALALQERGLMLNGLVLVSPALSFNTFIFEPGNDLPYLLFLPTCAATAWYHDRLPEKPAAIEAFLAQVRGFVENVYAPALMKGAGISPSEAQQVAAQLHRYTGIPVETWLACDLRITDMHFTKAVLARPGWTVGRLDSRFLGPDTAPRSHTSERDTSYDGPLGPYTGLINHYIRRTLGFDPPEPYRVLSMEVNEKWRWSTDKLAGLPDVTDALRKAITTNPHLRVLVANGYYDLATPFYGSEYSVAHLGLDVSLRGNVRVCSYEGGHMMYLHAPSRAKLRADLVGFYQAT